VLQGWELRDYARCVAMYRGAGVGLRDYPVVGVGSVCRRQATEEIAELAAAPHVTPEVALGFGLRICSA